MDKKTRVLDDSSDDEPSSTGVIVCLGGDDSDVNTNDEFSDGDGYAELPETKGRWVAITKIINYIYDSVKYRLYEIDCDNVRHGYAVRHDSMSSVRNGEPCVIYKWKKIMFESNIVFEPYRTGILHIKKANRTLDRCCWVCVTDGDVW